VDEPVGLGIGWRFFLLPLATGLMAGDFLFEWIVRWTLSILGWAAVLGASLFGVSLAMPWWGWWALFLGMPFLVLLLLLYLVVQPFTLTVVEMVALLIGVPVFLANQFLQMDQTLQRYRVGRAGIVGRIQGFRDWLYGTPQPVLPDDSQGARFATPEEVTAQMDPRGTVFGHVNPPLQLYTDKHLLIMASTRSGKGTVLIIPHLLRYAGSAFVLDPKGENARAT
jgi:hypothetical protein